MSSLSQGIHNAVCIGIIFTGKHQSFNRPLPKVTILWEITENEKIKTFSRLYLFLLREGRTTSAPRVLARQTFYSD